MNLVVLTRLATSPIVDVHSTLAGDLSPLLAETITPRDFSRMPDLIAVDATTTQFTAALGEAMVRKVNQILHSNNGHHVSSEAREKVNKLLEQYKFESWYQDSGTSHA